MTEDVLGLHLTTLMRWWGQQAKIRFVFGSAFPLPLAKLARGDWLLSNPSAVLQVLLLLWIQPNLEPFALSTHVSISIIL